MDFQLKSYGKYLSFLRLHPTHATKVLFGIVVPPHESTMLESCWVGYRENIFKCSRGTSKTFTVGSLFAPLKGVLYRNSRILVASASRFRGGKFVLKDSENLIGGHLKDQHMQGTWVRGAIPHVKTIKHEPDIWYVDFNSSSSVFTLPTNNEEAIRGIRANILILDERNTFDDDAIQTVYVPFLNVGDSFANPAQGASGNQIFSVGTIDYSYRGWHKEILSAKDIARQQYEAQKALMSQDWDTYDLLMAKDNNILKTASLSYIRFDYTDLLIPTQIGNYKVHYPGARKDKHIVWDERDKQELIYTYPVNKLQLESPLDQGLADIESWQAEQRNMFIMASGSVFPPALVEKVVGPIFTQSEESRKGWKAQDQGSRYVPPVLWECQDPCVLGVDTARTADFSAFVVVRIGDLPETFYNAQDYSLFANQGNTPWSNVIWAEQYQHMTSKDTAEMIHELRSRYNIIGGFDYPGIVMDARGGGVHVRDELANPSPAVDSTGRPVHMWKAPDLLYDPDDKEYHYLMANTLAWPGLKLLVTTDIMNQELVSFSRAQMDIGRLFIAAYKAEVERIDKD